MSKTQTTTKEKTPAGAAPTSVDDNKKLPDTPKKVANASLVAKFANRYSIDPGKLLNILKATAFKVKDAVVTDEQMAALLVVADQYGLNPFTREIFAFPDKQNGIVPVVGIDGWSRIINENDQFDGMDFNVPPEDEWSAIDEHSKRCPPWMEVIIYRKDRTHPIVIREYLDEVYKPPYQGTGKNGPYITKNHWQTHTKRALRHKTLIQGARIAFSYVGIYDEDEAERIIEGEIVEEHDFQSAPTKQLNENIKKQAAQKNGEVVAAGER